MDTYVYSREKYHRDKSNAVLLRQDIHTQFDARVLLFVPMASELVCCVIGVSDSYAQADHNQPLLNFARYLEALHTYSPCLCDIFPRFWFCSRLMATPRITISPWGSNRIVLGNDDLLSYFFWKISRCSSTYYDIRTVIRVKECMNTWLGK